MRIPRKTAPLLLGMLLFIGAFARAQAPASQPSLIVREVVSRITSLIEPTADAPAVTFAATLHVTRADGLPKEILGASIDLACQAPDRLLLSARVGGQAYTAGRDVQQLWAHVPARRFGVIGMAGLPRFAADPQTIDQTVLPPFAIPTALKAQLAMLPLLSRVEKLADETVNDAPCRVISLTVPAILADALQLPSARLELAVREDNFPARIRFTDGGGIKLEVQVRNPRLDTPWPADRWKLTPTDGHTIERVAISHLTSFMSIAQSMRGNTIPTLGRATGERRLVGTVGAGRLELWDQTRVLFLKGTPQEMGQQHGTLLRNEVRDVAGRMLYGVGVGSSFAKGDWFFGEIEQAQKRLAPFISDRFFAEMDALASAAGMSHHEIRLANFFPELFHCSGFAIVGDTTVDGRLYHGRVLDYLKGMGLEQNAVVMVMQPDQGNAWVNIGYAGFIGSVTAMNEKQIAIGEMGGRGEGNWDGKPMAQLMREVMERAGTLEEAVEIMRKGPRTCEYYYVISDGKTRNAVAIEATPTKFVTVALGEPHPRLPHAMKDTVLLSADARYEKLVERVKAGYGKIDAEAARALMDRPVAMGSNIQSVLFAPESLDFWVANADSKRAASHTRYTHYNLRELLKAAPSGGRR